MSKRRLKTISDTVLAETILLMKEGYGLWDQDPAVFPATRKDFNTLGNKMTMGVREVMRRIEEAGLEEHQPLKSIFIRVAPLSARDRGNAGAVFESLRDLPHRKEEKPRYDF
ncbi:MAG: hypothetical protein HY370_06645 [Proteobacteria bacterium]|nr:hypothetical protein [Pseudomonadota bacterium]